MADDVPVKLAEVDQRAKSNTRRIDKLELSTNALHELTLAVREMVVKQEYTTTSINQLNQKVDGIDHRIDSVEQKPAKRWESVVEKAIMIVVAAVIGFILAKIGL